MVVSLLLLIVVDGEDVSLAVALAELLDAGLSELGSLGVAGNAFVSETEATSLGGGVDDGSTRFSPGAGSEAGCMFSLRDSGSTGVCGKIVVIISGLRSGLTDD